MKTIRSWMQRNNALALLVAYVLATQVRTAGHAVVHAFVEPFFDRDDDGVTEFIVTTRGYKLKVGWFLLQVTQICVMLLMVYFLVWYFE